MIAHYEVIVGNVGSVYSGNNGFTANTKFQTYAGQSKAEYGRASGEDVTLLKNGEIAKEYYGTLATEDEA